MVENINVSLLSYIQKEIRIEDIILYKFFRGSFPIQYEILNILNEKPSKPTSEFVQEELKKLGKELSIQTVKKHITMMEQFEFIKKKSIGSKRFNTMYEIPEQGGISKDFFNILKKSNLILIYQEKPQLFKMSFKKFIFMILCYIYTIDFQEVFREEDFSRELFFTDKNHLHPIFTYFVEFGLLNKIDPKSNYYKITPLLKRFISFFGDLKQSIIPKLIQNINFDIEKSFAIPTSLIWIFFEDFYSISSLFILNILKSNIKSLDLLDLQIFLKMSKAELSKNIQLLDISNLILITRSSRNRSKYQINEKGKDLDSLIHGFQSIANKYKERFWSKEYGTK